MNNVAIVNLSTAGGLIYGPGSPTVYIGGLHVSLDQDSVTPHGINEHAGPTLIATNNLTVYANGKLIIVKNDPATCGHLVESTSTVLIG